MSELAIIVVAICATMVAYAMIRVLPRQLREMRCEHLWVGFEAMETFNNDEDERPSSVSQTFRCDRCGGSRTYEL